MEYIHEQEKFFVQVGKERIGSISVVERSLSCRRTISGKRVYLQDLNIRKEFRRKGYAIALLEYVFEWYGKIGIDEFTIAVDSNNSIAKSLYEKIGFELLQRGFDSYQNIEYELLIYQYRGKGAENV